MTCHETDAVYERTAMKRQPKYSRRALLAAGGAGAVALSGGFVGARILSGMSDDEPEASVGDFGLTPSSELLAPSRLRFTTVAQSFAFDDTRADVYVAQLVGGGLRLPGESRRPTSAERARHGDLCVNRLSSGGTLTGHMILRGFGHGVSFGVEPTGSGVLLWTESQAHPRTGYGLAVTRVPFTDGAVLDSRDPSLVHHRPVPGSIANQPSLDLTARRVLVSYWTADAAGRRRQWYAVHDMDAFLDGRYEPRARTRQRGRGPKETFQGCALHGDHVYQLSGTSYTAASGDNPPGSGGNARVAAIDLRDSGAAISRRTTVARTLEHREPEGLAVRLTDGPRLCVGFATGPVRGRMFTVHGLGRAQAPGSGRR